MATQLKPFDPINIITQVLASPEYLKTLAVGNRVIDPFTGKPKRQIAGELLEPFYDSSLTDRANLKQDIRDNPLMKVSSMAAKATTAPVQAIGAVGQRLSILGKHFKEGAKPILKDLISNSQSRKWSQDLASDIIKSPSVVGLTSPTASPNLVNFYKAGANGQLTQQQTNFLLELKNAIQNGDTFKVSTLGRIVNKAPVNSPLSAYKPQVSEIFNRFGLRIVKNVAPTTTKLSYAGELKKQMKVDQAASKKMSALEKSIRSRVERYESPVTKMLENQIRNGSKTFDDLLKEGYDSGTIQSIQQRLSGKGILADFDTAVMNKDLGVIKDIVNNVKTLERNHPIFPYIEQIIRTANHLLKK